MEGLKKQDAADQKSKPWPNPQPEENKQIESIAKQFREVKKIEFDNKRTEINEEPKKK